MKILFKISLSTLILLGAIRIPACGCDTGLGGEQDPNEKKNISSSHKNQNKNESIISKTSPTLDVEKIDDAIVGNFPLNNGFQYEDILKIFLFYRGIDPETTKSSALVCKEWHNAIREEKQKFRKYLNSPKADLNYLKKLFVHPSVFMSAQHELAAQFPQDLFRLQFIFPDDDSIESESLSSNNNSIESESLSSDGSWYEIPKIIGSYFTILKECPTCHPGLARSFVQLDPKDYLAVAMAAETLYISPSLQEMVKEIWEEDPIASDEFSRIIKSTESHDRLKNQLMALKLLILSGDYSSYKTMKEFDSILIQHYSQVFSPEWMMYDTMYLPLWSAYMTYLEPDCSIRHCILSLTERFNSTYIKWLKLKPVIAFMKYVTALRASIDGIHKLRVNLDDLLFLRGHESFCTKDAAFNLIKCSEGRASENLPLLVQLAWYYCMTNDYPKAINSLKEIYAHIDDSPYRFRFLWEMAEIILAQNDQENFSVAESCLRTLYEAFERTQASQLHAEFTNVIHSQKVVHPITCFECVLSIAALHIYKEKFEDAYKILKISPVFSIEIWNRRSLLRAIQIQYSLMPQELLELFKDELTCIKPGEFQIQRFAYENEGLYDCLFKNFPLDYEKFKEELEMAKEIIGPEAFELEEEKDKKKDNG